MHPRLEAECGVTNNSNNNNKMPKKQRGYVKNSDRQKEYMLVCLNVQVVNMLYSVHKFTPSVEKG